MPYDLCVTLDNKYLLAAIPTMEVAVYNLQTMELVKYL